MDRRYDFSRRSLHIFRASDAPRKILYLIGKDEACGFHLARKSNLEWISLGSVRDRYRHD